MTVDAADQAVTDAMNLAITGLNSANALLAAQKADLIELRVAEGEVRVLRAAMEDRRDE